MTTVAQAAPTGKLCRETSRRVPALLDKVRRWTYRLAWQSWERRYGIDTRGSIPGEALGNGPNCFGYQPLDYLPLVQGLSRIPIAANDDFLDYGCGKGRALLVAARYPFARLWGVEYSAELCASARENLRRCGKWGDRCRVVHKDATQFEVPDRVAVVLLYNPFQGDVLDRTLDQVLASWRRSPRPLHLLYALPRTDADRLAEKPWLEATQHVTTSCDEWLRMTIYRVRGDEERRS